MAKGFFTQGIAVLLESKIDSAALENALPNVIDRQVRDKTTWFSGKETLLIPFRTEVNGYVAVDMIGKPWPDGMGDPKTDPNLFSAWSMGGFGPYTFPGSLQRATLQGGAAAQAKALVPRHHAFLRIRMSYVFGAGDNDPVMPADCVPADELEFMTDIAMTVMNLPQALCYFNPSGELLHTLNRQHMHPIREHYRQQQMPPLDLWCNVRMWNVDEGGGWTLFDSVGMGQLDLPDMEACFSRGKYEPNEVALGLRNATLYLVQHGPVIKHGETIDLAGGVRWQGMVDKQAIVAPPRPTLRWLPQDGTEPPAQLR